MVAFIFYTLSWVISINVFYFVRTMYGFIYQLAALAKHAVVIFQVLCRLSNELSLLSSKSITEGSYYPFGRPLCEDIFCVNFMGCYLPQGL